MESKNNLPLVLLTLAVLAGAYFFLSSLWNLNNRLTNVEFAVGLKNQNTSTTDDDTTSSSPKLPILPSPETATSTEISLPTNIFFEASSSPTLLPQTILDVAIESLNKNSDGLVSLSVKISSSRAQSYSAINLNEIFAVIGSQGEVLRPYRLEGRFDSLAPRVSVSGRVFFLLPENQNLIMLRLGYPENASYYEVDFSKKEYRETFLG